jgi:c-di-GMP-binding flagellar brake protein YcgR
MIRKRDVPLKIELFSNGEDSQYLVRSKGEICSILKFISHNITRVALYCNEGNDFILTTVLKVNEQGIWLELGSIEANNQHILQSNKIIFVSSHNRVKIQFTANRVANVLLDGGTVFYMSLPHSLWRIQRREYYRLTTPVENPLSCIISATPPYAENRPNMPISKRKLTIMDISGGGVALVCEAQDVDMKVGKVYPDCQIYLPEVGTIIATVAVQNSFEVTLRNGQVRKRTGCEFTSLSNEAAMLLQRYVAQLQSGVVTRN